jgi:HEAT repeat protein
LKPDRALAPSVLLAVSLSVGAPVAAAQQDVVTPAQLQAAIDQLGQLDFATRVNASRTVRRATPAQAVPALIEAVTSHADGFVRFRALILLSGFNDPRSRSVVLSLLADPNDRLRSTAYSWLERNRTPEAIPQLLKALDNEESEFVRPQLLRALVAYGDDARVQGVVKNLVSRGQDFFRSIVIEALGDRKGAYAIAEVTRVAKLEGPLQDDAVLALGKIGDKRSLETFSALQRTAPRDVQPSIAAAICLLGTNCATHTSYLVDTVGFAVENSGFQELLRPAVGGLSAIAAARDDLQAVQALIDAGAPAQDPARAPIALGVGFVAIRNPALMLRVIQRQPDPGPTVELLREAFDMLEEDFEEEQFFATVRRAYWQAADGSVERKAAGTLIQKLEF